MLSEDVVSVLESLLEGALKDRRELCEKLEDVRDRVEKLRSRISEVVRLAEDVISSHGMLHGLEGAARDVMILLKKMQELACRLREGDMMAYEKLLEEMRNVDKHLIYIEERIKNPIKTHIVGFFKEYLGLDENLIEPVLAKATHQELQDLKNKVNDLYCKLEQLGQTDPTKKGDVLKGLKVTFSSLSIRGDGPSSLVNLVKSAMTLTDTLSPIASEEQLSILTRLLQFLDDDEKIELHGRRRELNTLRSLIGQFCKKVEGSLVKIFEVEDVNQLYDETIGLFKDRNIRNLEGLLGTIREMVDHRIDLLINLKSLSERVKRILEVVKEERDKVERRGLKEFLDSMSEALSDLLGKYSTLPRDSMSLAKALVESLPDAEQLSMPGAVVYNSVKQDLINLRKFLGNTLKVIDEAVKEAPPDTIDRSSADDIKQLEQELEDIIRDRSPGLEQIGNIIGKVELVERAINSLLACYKKLVKEGEMDVTGWLNQDPDLVRALIDVLREAGLSVKVIIRVQG